MVVDGWRNRHAARSRTTYSIDGSYSFSRPVSVNLPASTATDMLGWVKRSIDRLIGTGTNAVWLR